MAMSSPLTILGIETSCDETAVAIVTQDRQVLAHHILSQAASHAHYGGVVPEIAARQHIAHLDSMINSSLAEAGIGARDLSAIAATAGPGLIGGLMVGVLTAKALAFAAGRPFIAVNHLAAHALTVRLTDDVAFPYVLLLVSGGHAQLMLVRGVDNFERLGTTLDDAVGEAFDKTAKLLGLGYPGGPAVEAAARNGDAARFALPTPMVGRGDCHFSFSGLKTAVRRAAEECAADGGLTRQDIADISASFQRAISVCLADRSRRAICLARQRLGLIESAELPFVLAGGVAANQALRGDLEALCRNTGCRFVAPPPALCTDNGAMVAWAGLERLRATPGLDEQHVSARPRWPLDTAAEPLVGSGKKGGKA